MKQGKTPIQNLTVDLETGRISWLHGDKDVEVTVPELTGAMADSKGRNVFALFGDSNFNPTHLLGFSPSGSLLFRVEPPPGFRFSYLTLHPDAPIAVVAGGQSITEAFPDWHFSIRPSGELKKLAPAY
jgi:hypothetical protein